MRDEELAEQSERKYYATHTDYNKHEGYIAGFLAGLKTGRPKWHYPSKDDIPVESGEYFVIAESDHTLYTSLENYDPDDNEWSTCWKIVAWQHIDIPEEIYDREV